MNRLIVNRESRHPIGAAFAGVLLFVIGLGIGGGTIESNWRAAERRQGLRYTDGTVVDVVAGHPLIAYLLPSGERVSFTAREADPREYPLSDKVPLVYDPARPDAAQIDPRGARWTRNGLAAFASITLMALGGYVAWYARRDDARHGQA